MDYLKRTTLKFVANINFAMLKAPTKDATQLQNTSDVTLVSD